MKLSLLRAQIESLWSEHGDAEVQFKFKFERGGTTHSGFTDIQEIRVKPTPITTEPEMLAAIIEACYSHDFLFADARGPYIHSAAPLKRDYPKKHPLPKIDVHEYEDLTRLCATIRGELAERGVNVLFGIDKNAYFGTGKGATYMATPSDVPEGKPDAFIIWEIVSNSEETGY